ncbi:restriction endonuclease subunit S [Pseudomonas frederiksbergensis]|uniref:restriction endonuclease subunit S n=1 Tax=Pseudomonas frederiksbergensis TaxID=104087 RepID=UPI003D968FA3
MNWPVVELGDVCDFENGDRGKNYPSKDAFVLEGIPFINAGSLSDSIIDRSKLSFITEEHFQRLSNGKVKEGDVLFCLRGSLGKFALVKDIKLGAIASSLIIIRPKSNIDLNYLKHFLGSPLCYREISNFENGAAQPNLSGRDLKRFKIPLPPLLEQKNIAAILDKADAIRRKRQQTIKLADELLRATFLDMFGDPVSNPKGWEVQPLRHYIVHANNGISRRREELENRGDIVLRLQDVQYDGIHFEKELNRIALDDAERSRFRLEIGDILFIRVNGNPDYVGRSAVFHGYHEPVYHNDHLIRIKVGNALKPEFLSYCFNHEGGRRIISTQIKTSAGQHTISQGGIESLRFYLPPVSLQEKFIRLMNKVGEISFNKKFSEDLFNSLSKKAFSGEL